MIRDGHRTPASENTPHVPRSPSEQPAAPPCRCCRSARTPGKTNWGKASRQNGPVKKTGSFREFLPLVPIGEDISAKDACSEASMAAGHNRIPRATSYGEAAPRGSKATSVRRLEAQLGWPGPLGCSSESGPPVCEASRLFHDGAGAARGGSSSRGGSSV